MQVVRGLAARTGVINLRVPVEVATDRAAAERGEAWLVRSDQVARADGHSQPDRLARIDAWTKAHSARTDDELQLAACARRRIGHINASGSPPATLSQTFDAWANIRDLQA